MANYYPNNQKKIFIILIFILINSCTKEKTSIQIIKLNKISRSKLEYRKRVYKIDTIGDNLFFYNIDISIDNYTVGVNTYFIEDTLHWSEHYGYEFPIVTKQEIYFIQKADTVWKIPYSVPNVIKKSTKGNMYYVPENQIIRIGFIQGKFDTICNVTGFGGCNACTEYGGYYHLSGDLIWEFYTFSGYSSDTGFIEEVRYFKSEFAKMGIPTKDRKEQKMITVFPLEEAGEVYKRGYVALNTPLN